MVIEDAKAPAAKVLIWNTRNDPDPTAFRLNISNNLIGNSQTIH